ncbi:hypothetical protein [Streptomyces inhibens]|uniref:hypothetical protein n=1 Tax=Streptomyces inhibens TaxID=2293571 RepID=UPI001FD60F05|nr:hypothetical protein [Streptomyces inhibens]
MIFIANDSTRHDIHVAREHRRSIGLVRYRFDTAHVFSGVGGCWGLRKIGTNAGWDSHNGWDRPGRKRHLLRRL